MPNAITPSALQHLGAALQEVPEAPKPPMGVYFLIQGDAVQYVGQSRDLWGRIKMHRQGGLISFDHVLYVPVPEDELAAVERRFIRELRPPHNGGLWSPFIRAREKARHARLLAEGRCFSCEAVSAEGHEEWCEEMTLPFSAKLNGQEVEP